MNIQYRYWRHTVLMRRINIKISLPPTKNANENKPEGHINSFIELRVQFNLKKKRRRKENILLY